MFYDKQIRYLEYLENGEKIRSAGFVKIEVIDKVCNIQVNVTGLHPSENCTREVHVLGMQEQGVLGSITFLSGKGNLGCRRIPTDQLCEGIGYEELRSIRISLGKNRELLCRWREDEREESQKQENGTQEHAAERSKAEPVATMEEDVPHLIASAEEMLSTFKEPAYAEGSTSRPSDTENFVTESLITETSVKEPLCSEPLTSEVVAAGPPSVEDFTVKPSATEVAATEPSMPPRLNEDKWKQLADIYPHISPFHDDRDYLSIGPNDFVVLPKKHYRLISNSFLLHGFYNYGHLILARTVKRGEEMFYLGVPGNFFEREKQVAIMFGFESFECKKEPAMDGDFGYFMIKIEL
ncbi:MAG: hypothetical protein IJ390_08475 [Lachnospiraceae bacterium]|nr:hypothetical protein [Lachnospiraceae bacterium]